MESRLLTNVTVSQPSGTYSATYGYDAARRLSTVSSTAGNFAYTCWGAGRLWTNVALPNTSAITNHYDTEAGVLSTLLNNSGNTTLNSHAYVYNQASQRTQVIRRRRR